MRDLSWFVAAALLWIAAIVVTITAPGPYSSYAKGFQVRSIDKQWRV